MGKHLPYKKAQNYAHHRCNHTIVAFDKSEINTESAAIEAVSEYLSGVQGTWTASWSNRKNELTVYAKDTETLSYVSMISR